MKKYIHKDILKVVILLFLFSLYIKHTNGWGNKKELCVCDFTNKLNQVALEKKYITCNLTPSHGDHIRIIGNSEYVFECFKNAKIYCPSKSKFITNVDISNHSKLLKYEIHSDTINKKSVNIYDLFIDANATDLLFLCFIKPAQISEFVRGTVKIDLKRVTKEEYSIKGNRKNDICNFASGNLNISPSMGNYENSRTVNCIHKVKANKLFTLKLPTVDNKVSENFLPQLLNCLSEYPIINFTVKEVEQKEENLTINMLFGSVSKEFNLTCTFDLSKYEQGECAIGRKGNVVFLFTPENQDNTMIAQQDAQMQDNAKGTENENTQANTVVQENAK